MVKFGKTSVIQQICQGFPPPKTYAILYIMHVMCLSYGTLLFIMLKY